MNVELWLFLDQEKKPQINLLSCQSMNKTSINNLPNLFFQESNTFLVQYIFRK